MMIIGFGKKPISLTTRFSNRVGRRRSKSQTAGKREAAAIFSILTNGLPSRCYSLTLQTYATLLTLLSGGETEPINDLRPLNTPLAQSLDLRPEFFRARESHEFKGKRHLL